ncbi:class I adenylate-forming enzyme family protein [Actinomadura rupiterrae]|uniref:class I adenylate-forming enzyme family protein n=1 Tax=Actinomadura rupiterrae TaxID=559627 RepID=UPI0020A3CB58|nr:AMP-binding protein [Actinomadura rupiterrae]MCP2338688.1 long-chain acyl-CoA synthetase [Actinomadura rupiterrae]
MAAVNTEGMPAGAGREPSASMVECLRRAMADAPDRTAIVCDDRTMSYAELGRSAAGLARRMSGGVAEGRAVALLMPNGPELSVSAFAAWMAGAQVALMNPAFTDRELRLLLERSGANLVLASAGAPEEAGRAAAAAESLGLGFLLVGEGDLSLGAWQADATLAISDDLLPPPDRPATMMFTGGTTGVPKGVDHTHRTLMLTVQGMEACWPTRPGAEVWLNVAPSFHIWGLLMGILNPVYGQATVVTCRRFKPDAVALAIRDHGVTVFGGGPAEIYAGLLSSEHTGRANLRMLRVCPGGGSRFSAALHDRWLDRTGVPIREAFGMTELAPISCNRWDVPPRPGSVGPPAASVEVRVVDLEDPSRLAGAGQAGEIQVRAPHMTIGYHDPAQGDGAFVDGWLNTGDIGYLDEDGYLFIVDRRKDMIIVGGFNVYPREIDETLCRYPGIVEAATVGVPDDRRGERPVSFVVTDRGKALDEAALAAYCTANLAHYKQPRAVRLVDRLPRTAANKIDVRALRTLAAEE